MLQITTNAIEIVNVERIIVADNAIVAERDLHKVARSKRHSVKRPFPASYWLTGTLLTGGTPAGSDGCCLFDGRMPSMRSQRRMESTRQEIFGRLHRAVSL